MKISSHPLYKAIVKDAWSYTTGALLLALLNISLFIVSGRAWGVTSAFANWGAWIYQALGGQPEKWAFFAANESNLQGLRETSFLTNTGSVQNIGIIIGALLATLLASQFKVKKIKSWRQIAAAVLGGLLMGYGARLAFGCNIGTFFSGIASFSLHGWLFGIFLLVGAWIGSKLLVKYFMS